MSEPYTHYIFTITNITLRWLICHFVGYHIKNIFYSFHIISSVVEELWIISCTFVTLYINLQLPLLDGLGIAWITHTTNFSFSFYDIMTVHTTGSFGNIKVNVYFMSRLDLVKKKPTKKSISVDQNLVYTDVSVGIICKNSFPLRRID